MNQKRTPIWHIFFQSVSQQDSVSDKTYDILFDIDSDLLLNIDSHILSDIDSDLLSDIDPDIHSYNIFVSLASAATFCACQIAKGRSGSGTSFARVNPRSSSWCKKKGPSWPATYFSLRWGPPTQASIAGSSSGILSGKGWPSGFGGMEENIFN